jgi:hypothetical protein
MPTILKIFRMKFFLKTNLKNKIFRDKKKELAFKMNSMKLTGKQQMSSMMKKIMK